MNYGSTRVVDNLDLALADDEVLMLVGPTGCGKTTILQALAGLVPISGGEIQLGHWRSTPSKAVPPEKRNVGMVFQDFALFPHLTVEQNVCFRLRDTAKADHWLQLLGLDDFRHARPNRLSGGQKQRVALARSLAHEPAFILLDEPLSNLDAALKDSLRWEIREALKAAGVPAIWVTHDQEEALSVGDRVGILKDGRLEQLDTPEKCYAEPASRFVARFLGEASFLPGRLQGEQVATVLGPAPGVPINGASGDVDLLLRPDDLSLTPMETGNGVIDWVRYEGSSRLYAVNIDGGAQLKVRVNHEVRAQPGEPVHMAITTTHPLAVFPRQQ
ncbi:ABC transporter ATP-binding protein [Microbulbifer sp. YPW16]|uniref:ABC transporter ATP-binding protein n=1 Tax=unclassified Microbulbifer TaxID=2619833 RepID=UPI001E510FD7|nr:ABC transporter ATP-binding protein [Microbulbifer sp. YPW16]UHQ55083.1 ABC transporter ATP-binding protein [Microbulbifer sp. YPW16]